MPTKISLVLIAKDEGKNIKRCLSSAKNMIDEIIVVDTGSSDNTLELARKFGAMVFEYKWEDDFSKARNFAISKASGDWIISLDADEYFTQDYSFQIREFIDKGRNIGRIKIISKFLSDGQIKESQAFISRIFPRGMEYTGRIHEQLNSNLDRVNLNIEVYHNGYFKTDKTERNIKLLNAELTSNPDDSYFLYQLGKEYRSRRDFNKARECLEKSYHQLERSHAYAANVILEYLNTCIKGGFLEEANRVISNEKVFMSKSPDFQFTIGIFLMDNLMKNLNEATIHKLPLIENAFKTSLQLGDRDEVVRGTGSFMAAYNLGAYYEAIGKVNLAKEYYKKSALQQFEPAIKRLSCI